MSARSKQPAALPLAWYWTLPTLCRLYDCHVDQLYYALDAGQLKASALVPKHRLPSQAHKGPAPSVCIVLHDYRSLAWQHADGDAIAYITGEYMAFVVDGDGFTPLPLELNDPVKIARRDLVILDESKEEMEATVVSRPRRGNKAEQKATAVLIAALVRAAYPEDLEKPYRIANKVCNVIEGMGAQLSRQAAANKIREALAVKTDTDSPLALCNV